ncbi:uncharacterized protein LOC108150083 [Drosophila elegans]|uniref:uncharacterized protein LOC108150083 n=1 Tax=Drosophila elegans TaxID=30023 RepID=UPI001BC849BF|nr:uncharacterized protein LOC108150083 [Drosophila elegans]
MVFKKESWSLWRQIVITIMWSTSRRLINVVKKGNIEIVLESLETNCDHDYVEYFKRVSNSSLLYTFRVVKLAPTFTIDITMKVAKTRRILYKMEQIKGCEFLNNPVLFKVLSKTYEGLVVNGSYFKCPIKPKVYFLKHEGTIALFPSIHPPGRFQLSVRIKMSESRRPFVMEMLWKYKVLRIK